MLQRDSEVVFRCRVLGEDLGEGVLCCGLFVVCGSPRPVGRDILSNATVTAFCAFSTSDNIHLSGHQAQHGADHPGEPGIDGKMRGPANTKGQI